MVSTRLQLNGRAVVDAVVDNIDLRDYPDFCDAYFESACYEDGTVLTDEELEQVCRIDPTEGCRFVVVTPENGEEVMVGTGGYFKEDDDFCVMTIVVADAWQGTQIAHRLLMTLIQRAVADGFNYMMAKVLATNRKMLRFAQRHGFTLDPSTEKSSVKTLVRCLRAERDHLEA